MMPSWRKLKKEKKNFKINFNLIKILKGIFNER